MSNASMFDLTGKVAAVSGAAGGLGSAICAGLAAAGADIALLDLDAATLATAAASVEAEGRRALAIEGDAADEQSVDDAFAQIDKTFGKVDILVNLPFATISGAPQYPPVHYILDGSKLTRHLGVEMTTGNRRMLEEYWNVWDQVPDHTPRRYAREDKALAALGLDQATQPS
jgi:hypothetical protein